MTDKQSAVLIDLITRTLENQLNVTKKCGDLVDAIKQRNFQIETALTPPPDKITHSPLDWRQILSELRRAEAAFSGGDYQTGLDCLRHTLRILDDEK